ncbi:hypothetical protein SD77_2403 [Bacillus badius]|uniref:Ribose 5-phosphate isomerase B n=1 Tax=Bacillus badius TaxID=1455 RepID=A0ABR5AYY5_BACBA|nr:hypothetical protein SD78_2138 [Bacillus badius]KIL79949.1 hypothetical protein SD77_2403 [Bacillus badius]
MAARKNKKIFSPVKMTAWNQPFLRPIFKKRNKKTAFLPP